MGFACDDAQLTHGLSGDIKNLNFQILLALVRDGGSGAPPRCQHMLAMRLLFEKNI